MLNLNFLCAYLRYILLSPTPNIRTCETYSKIIQAVSLSFTYYCQMKLYKLFSLPTCPSSKAKIQTLTLNMKTVATGATKSTNMHYS